MQILTENVSLNSGRGFIKGQAVGKLTVVRTILPSQFDHLAPAESFPYEEVQF